MSIRSVVKGERESYILILYINTTGNSVNTERVKDDKEHHTNTQ
jgi:hypothetical protein